MSKVDSKFVLWVVFALTLTLPAVAVFGQDREEATGKVKGGMKRAWPSTRHTGGDQCGCADCEGRASKNAEDEADQEIDCRAKSAEFKSIARESKRKYDAAKTPEEKKLWKDAYKSAKDQYRELFIDERGPCHQWLAKQLAEGIVEGIEDIEDHSHGSGQPRKPGELEEPGDNASRHKQTTRPRSFSGPTSPDLTTRTDSMEMRVEDVAAWHHTVHTLRAAKGQPQDSEEGEQLIEGLRDTVSELQGVVQTVQSLEQATAASGYSSAVEADLDGLHDPRGRNEGRQAVANGLRAARRAHAYVRAYGASYARYLGAHKARDVEATTRQARAMVKFAILAEHACRQMDSSLLDYEALMYKRVNERLARIPDGDSAWEDGLATWLEARKESLAGSSETEHLAELERLRALSPQRLENARTLHRIRLQSPELAGTRVPDCMRSLEYFARYLRREAVKASGNATGSGG